MDQKVQSQGGEAAGVILIVVGIILLPLAIGLFFAFPDWIWLLGLLLSGCSYVIISGGIKSIRKARNELVRTRETIGALMKNRPPDGQDTAGKEKAKIGLSAIDSNEAEQVIIWQYTPEEWKIFVKWEKKDRKMNAVVTGILVALIGAVFVKLQRDATWGMAVLVATLIGVIYAFMIYLIGMSSLKGFFKKQPEVRITHRVVLINGVLNVFADQDRMVHKISILEKVDPMVLEIVYKFYTARGASQDELHIPIPKGKLGEAVRLVEVLKKVHGILPAE